MKSSATWKILTFIFSVRFPVIKDTENDNSFIGIVQLSAKFCSDRALAEIFDGKNMRFNIGNLDGNGKPIIPGSQQDDLKIDSIRSVSNRPLKFCLKFRIISYSQCSSNFSSSKIFSVSFIMMFSFNSAGVSNLISWSIKR